MIATVNNSPFKLYSITIRLKYIIFLKLWFIVILNHFLKDHSTHLYYSSNYHATQKNK